MNADNKKGKQNKKIIPFETRNEISRNRDIDQMVKNSLKQEADKLETELNADPKLKGVGASDDMLQSIVDKLKAQGIWEEEPHKIGGGSDIDGGSDISGVSDINGRSDTEDSSDIDGKSGENGVPDMDDISKIYRLPEMDKDEYAPKIQNLEEIYAMLPESDLRAMALGRKVEYEQFRKKVMRRRRRKLLRYGGAVVAVFGIVFGLSMTSEANRRLVKRAWDVMAANFNFHVQTDYSGDEEQVRSKSREEVAAMEDISESLGISAISFEFLPSEMAFEDYDIVADQTEAVMFYSYQETILTVTIINVGEEGSTYYMMDQEAVPLDTIVTVQDFEAEMWETNQELDEKDRAYIAEIEHEGCRYILNGILPLEEMKKIIKFAYIL